VGDEKDGVAAGVQIVQQAHHFGAAGAVERAGGLVGQDHRAAVHQRPGDRDALLLAARKLVGPVVEPLA
jgi:hypothetical protein